MAEAIPLIQSRPPEKLPEIPKPLTKCLKTSARQGKDANERVINLLALAEERKLCGQGIIKWYDGVRGTRDVASNG